MITKDGGRAFAMGADVTKPGAGEAIVAEAKNKLGRLDILVNNVGIGGRDGPAHTLAEPDFDRTFTVNFKGMWLTIKAAIPVMRAQGGGAIVNISSMASVAGGHQVAYEVSKAGVNRMTTGIALANAKHNIRCNADTPMAVAGIARASGREEDAVRAERDARVPLGRKMGSGWDTAYAALFLASDEAKFITGVLLPVDGGMSVQIG